MKSLQSLKGLQVTCLGENHELLSIHHTDYDTLAKRCYFNVFCVKRHKNTKHTRKSLFKKWRNVIFSLISIVEGILSDSAFWWLAIFAGRNIPRVARERSDVMCALSLQASQCQNWQQGLASVLEICI